MNRKRPLLFVAASIGAGLLTHHPGGPTRTYMSPIAFHFTSALFVSAGGYHHHLGLNTWHSAGSGPAAPGSIGLRSYEIVLPDRDELHRVSDRVRDAGLTAENETADSAAVRDPSGNLITLRCR